MLTTIFGGDLLCLESIFILTHMRLSVVVL